MADTMASIALPQRPIIPIKKAHRKRKSDQDNAQTGQHEQTGPAQDETSDGWWTEIIHQHHTLLTSHSRILSAILKTSPPASARHDTISKFLANTKEMLGQVGGLENNTKRRRSGGSEVLTEPGAKRRNAAEEEEAELLSPSPSPSGEERGTASHALPVQGGKKMRVERVEPPKEVEVEVDDLRAEVEARLKVKEREKLKMKEGSKKRRRRSSTLEADERKREKRVKRESFGKKRGSPEAEVEGKEDRKRRRRVT
ncbi:hypothetical protein V499_07460 [Pseudogymnoascus sp. VKM F-103]|uniref:Uncharacterized protein n=1 Tax=Pseudogymnoascus verrucosus TaxID=342668 RepID=A0A1B8GSF1_9PEZI|nr:uncharacterized protein VE01_03306 [Pseudogymnoascus verrucosus]KFY72414.1 hypothetical protein V499_07460 [Pseudogymnoascus sp. VKM F-103]OBT98764.2 hypothetical protein VE01_03306 [Pseudogymnoascus verrucosus]